MTNKIPKIRGFHNVVKLLEKDARDLDYESLTWALKYKIHGTNAGIRIERKGSEILVVPQKKTDDLTILKDNFGFAQWVATLPKGFFEPLLKIFTLKDGDNIVLMGEWAGPGVQKSVAASQIPEKHFFPFCIFDSNNRVYYHTSFKMSMESLGSAEELKELKIIPIFVHKTVSVNAKDRDELKLFVESLNNHVAEIEACDPFIKEHFGVKGTGEGIVAYPPEFHLLKKYKFEQYAFKVKGEKHAVNKAGKPARIKSKIPESAYEFADQHCTEARLEQAVQEVGGLKMEYTGKFIGWICRDIVNESTQEIAESGLDWKTQLSGVIATKARNWYHEKVKEI